MQLRLVAALALGGLALTSVTHAQTSTAAQHPGTVANRPGISQLPELGDGSELTASAERRLGDGIARDMFHDPDYIDDPVVYEYVDAIWQSLLAAARASGGMSAELDQRFAWQILMGRDPTVNAFALPGGYLGLNLGLVAVVTSRDELASVLGHELSHVTQRHISRLISRQGRQMPLMIGAMILGALAASKSPDAASALIVGGQAMTIQNQLNFSRDMEREADRVGFNVMTQAGFAPQGFVSMFEKLQQAARFNDTGDFPYLRNHPLTTERIADMQARQRASGASSTPIPLTLEQAMVSARARVLSTPAVDGQRQLAGEAASATLGAQPAARQAGALYAGALAASNLRDFAEAHRFLTRLEAVVQGDAKAVRLATLLSVELALRAGQPAPVLAGSDRPEVFLSSQVLIGTGRAGEAASKLQTWVARHPKDASAWLLLSRAYSSQGMTLRAIRADGEAQVAQLDYPAALDRFKAAQALVHNKTDGVGADYIEASIVDTRARQMESLIREQALKR
ncbi:MAG: M48 family metalloprotease [Burkholderiaceae bacterium]